MQRRFLTKRGSAIANPSAPLTTIDDIISHVGRDKLEKMIFWRRSNIENIYSIIMEKDMPQDELCKKLSRFMFGGEDICDICHRRQIIPKEFKYVLPNITISAFFGFADIFAATYMDSLVGNRLITLALTRGNDKEKVEIVRRLAKNDNNNRFMYGVFRDNMELFYMSAAKRVIDPKFYVEYLLSDNREIVNNTIIAFGGNVEAARLFLYHMSYHPSARIIAFFDKMDMTRDEIVEIYGIVKAYSVAGLYFESLREYLQKRREKMMFSLEIITAMIFVDLINKDVLAEILEEYFSEYLIEYLAKLKLE